MYGSDIYFVLYLVKKMFDATTIVAVRKNGQVAIAGDGQVTFGQSTVMKHKAKKVRKIYHDQILAGFAGSVADAFALFEKFEGKLEENNGNLKKSAVALTKDWRGDKILRKLEAMMLVADQETILLLSGSGEVIEPDEGVAAIGSGGNYALAAAVALAGYTDLNASETARKAMEIAADICVYTNHQITVYEL